MRSLTGFIILGSAILIVAVAIFVRFDTTVDPPPPPPVSLSKPETRSTGDARPARVEDRLGRLRTDYQERKAADERALAADAPQATRRELPKSEARVEADSPTASSADLQEWRHTALHDPDPDERSGAILMLSGENDPETFQVLIEAMTDRSAEVRLAAVEALGDFSEELKPEVLLPALQDRDPEVRFEAVGILGDMETPEALDLVRQSLDDPDEDVRSLAEGILELADPVPPKTMQEVLLQQAEEERVRQRMPKPRFVIR
jgi:HEAT repeat protein